MVTTFNEQKQAMQFVRWVPVT